MATEYEYKYKVSQADMLSLMESFPQPTKEIHMETVYYDTPSGSLSARHYTLRRRKENDTYICTLKTPAGDARNEWETENTSITDAIPQLIALGAPEQLQELVKEGLNPICGAKFTRLAKLIPITDGLVEMALDYGYLFAGDKKETISEMELELKSGDKKSFELFAWSVSGEFLLEEEPKSKFARARKLYKGE